MAASIVVSCPQCQKQIKARAELKGKKIRCKGCGQVFPVQAVAAKAQAPSTAPGSDKPNPYGMTGEAEALPRCPHCAQEMESAEAVVCLSCGYNTQIRQRMTTRKVIETTSNDQFLWLLPGIICAVLVVLLIAWDLFYCLVFPKMAKGDEFLQVFAYGGLRLWSVIFSFFVMFFLGKFAIKRLVFNRTPPEREAN